MQRENKIAHLMRAEISTRKKKKKEQQNRFACTGMQEDHDCSSHILLIFLFVVQSFHGVLDVLCRLERRWSVDNFC